MREDQEKQPIIQINWPDKNIRRISGELTTEQRFLCTQSEGAILTRTNRTSDLFVNVDDFFCISFHYDWNTKKKFFIKAEAQRRYMDLPRFRG